MLAARTLFTSFLSGRRATESQALSRSVQSLVVVITIALVVLPLFPIVIQSVILEPLYSDTLTFTLRNFGRLVENSEILDVVATTLVFSVCIAVLSTVMGALMAVLATRTDMWGAHIIGSTFLVPIYTSSLVLAFAWITV